MSRTLTGNSREKERVIQQQTIGRIASKMMGGFEGVIKSAVIEAADVYAEDGSDVGLASIVPRHVEELEKLIRAEWSSGMEAGGRRVLSAAKAIHGPMHTKARSVDDEFSQAVDALLKSDALRRARGIAEATVQDMRARIKRGIDQGESVDEIARGLKSKAPQISSYRSMVIARTESHAAYNAGHQAAAEASGLPLKREWVAASDGRTRDGKFDHRAADGEIVGPNEYFTRTGEDLKYPGDPSGSAGNTIHCRCAVVDVLEDRETPVAPPPRQSAEQTLDERAANLDLSKDVDADSMRYSGIAPTKETLDGLLTTDEKARKAAAAVGVTPKKVRISEEEERSRFRPSLDGPGELFSENSKAVFSHEYGHFLDFNAGRKIDGTPAYISTRRNMKKSVDKDAKALGIDPRSRSIGKRQRAKNGYKIRRRLYDAKYLEAGTNREGKPLYALVSAIPRFDKNIMINDIYDALSRGSLMDDKIIFAGHGRKYFRREGSREKEIFANLYALRGTPEYDVVKEDAPNVVAEFERILDEIIDNA